MLGCAHKQVNATPLRLLRASLLQPTFALAPSQSRPNLCAWLDRSKSLAAGTAAIPAQDPSPKSRLPNANGVRALKEFHGNGRILEERRFTQFEAGRASLLCDTASSLPLFDFASTKTDNVVCLSVCKTISYPELEVMQWQP